MQGTVAFVNEKNWNGKTLYSFKLQNDNTLYTCGVTRPQAHKGDNITFEGRETGNGRVEVDMKTVQVRKAEVIQPSGTFKPRYDDSKRQETIEWQAARNSAIAATGVIIQAGALKLPAKEADKFAAVTMLISELTNRFFMETKTLGTGLEKNAEPEKEEVPAETTKKEEGEWD